MINKYTYLNWKFPAGAGVLPPPKLNDGVADAAKLNPWDCVCAGCAAA